MQKKEAPVQRYFAAVNSAKGFQSYFSDLFGGLSHLYIIKGGSGTGKSHLMREIARRAELRGEKVEYYHCSSDPASLDGIRLCGANIGVVDGTAPHTQDPIYPGVTDEIVNVGDFWDTQALTEQKKTITSLIDEKKLLYDRLYSYLGAAGQMKTLLRQLILPAVQTEKLDKATKRFFRPYEGAESGKAVYRITEAFGMDGAVAFDTLEANASCVYHIKDRYDIADLFLEKLHLLSNEKKIAHTLSPSVLLPNRLRTLSIGNVLCLTAVEDHLIPNRKPPEKIWNMERFLDKKYLSDCRQRIRFCQRCEAECLQEAKTVFAKIKQLHFELESCYIRCMDFARKEAFTEQLLLRILP